MDNQSTSPQLVFPNVPDDFCPTGNWSEVLQQFVDIVLANGTINVPGLGDVTPQEITDINAQLDSQQLQIDALDIRVDTAEVEIDTLQSDVSALQLRPTITVRTGVIPVAVGASSVNITFAALPSADYGVTIIPVGTATTSSTMGSYVLQSGQSTTGFTIIVQDNPATVTNFRWTAIHTS